jgi:hypothetical protein
MIRTECSSFGFAQPSLSAVDLVCFWSIWYGIVPRSSHIPDPFAETTDCWISKDVVVQGNYLNPIIDCSIVRLKIVLHSLSEFSRGN